MLVRVAVPLKIFQALDYLPLENTNPDDYQPGQRVLVQVKNKNVIGLIISCITGNQYQDLKNKYKYKPIIDKIDSLPILSEKLINLLNWASVYYHHPPGLVIAAALPSWLRQGKPNQILKPKKNNINNFIKKNNHIILNTEQKLIFDNISKSLNKFSVNLIYGVTGSGKTEIYLELMQKVLNQNKQVIYLVPEITLTPQTIDRIQNRFLEQNIAVIHSKLTAKQKFQAWHAASIGQSNIIIGTRSSAFTELKNPGIFIIDEEHDSSYKQQDNFRYCAKQFLIMRAKNHNIPVILGSATPTLDCLYKTETNKFNLFQLKKRAYDTILPAIKLIDVNHKKLIYNLSPEAITALRQNFANKKQSLIFLNRRGYAPVIICNDCKWLATCKSCNSKMTLHNKINKIICHHCGYKQIKPIKCPKCNNSDIYDIGIGTEQLEESLNRLIPEARIMRLDLDSITPKILPEKLNDIKSHNIDIIIGTQIVAKGHDFPNLNLVIILDPDQALYAGDYTATERMGQLIFQVAGRAGRRQEPGTVLIQSKFTEHKLLQAITHHDYSNYINIISQERKSANLTPYCYTAVFLARHKNYNKLFEFLKNIKNTCNNSAVRILGPAENIKPKIANYYRGQIIFESNNRVNIHKTMDIIINNIENKRISVKGCTWAVDIDPQSFD